MFAGIAFRREAKDQTKDEVENREEHRRMLQAAGHVANQGFTTPTRWQRLPVSDLERGQLRLLRRELGIDPDPTQKKEVQKRKRSAA